MPSAPCFSRIPVLFGLVLVLTVAIVPLSSAQIGGCISNNQCNDGVFCNGPESCVNGRCIRGTPPCIGFCNLLLDRCVECLNDGQCDDGAFCNGTEGCSGNSCVAGSNPCSGTGCYESIDVCGDCLEDSDCDDGIFCNGREICEDNLCYDDTDPCNDMSCSEVGPTCGSGPVGGHLLHEGTLQGQVAFGTGQDWFLTLAIQDSKGDEVDPPILFTDVLDHCDEMAVNIVASRADAPDFDRFTDRLADSVEDSLTLSYKGGPNGTGGGAIEFVPESEFDPKGDLRGADIEAIRVKASAPSCRYPYLRIEVIPEPASRAGGLACLLALTALGRVRRVARSRGARRPPGKRR